MFEVDPLIINLSTIANRLSLGRLWDFANKVTLGLIENKKNLHTNYLSSIVSSKEMCGVRNKIKHQLSASERLNIIKSRLVFKYRIRTIWYEYKVSFSLVYSILKFYYERGISKLEAKTIEKNLINN